MKKTAPSISVFFPFLNDWGTVGSLVSLAIGSVEKITQDWEVILVNDGSRIDDRQALQIIVDLINNRQQTKGSHNRVRIIDHEQNKGYGGALRTGFSSSSKDLVFYTDCDAQYDPRELGKLYEQLTPDTAMVNGYKIKRHDPWFRIIAGRAYHHMVKILFHLPIRDTDCDFRLIRREVFQKVKLFENTGTICLELVKKIDHAGYKIREVPVHHFWRTSGKSQFFNFKRLYKTALNLIKLWWKLQVENNYSS